ncbi:uncharacterized protein LOC125708584 [Brienomyrus brachyistius]|uniref:uncharacterized protein LOC125708584 n=1 Tax=Brienomyrus brachyistius TaxID=42636 RepID=UPI0020B38D29|nr:uncharacterized protein LOC125708584 [Brienomyrus brachyistius]XP_048832191.1 uncharacterized protein LOC125708584 [Brienomyrus brachyistius]
MPVKRALRLEEKENITPSKRPALDWAYSPSTGTCSIHHIHSSSANLNLRENAGSPTLRELQTDKEKFHALRSKIEASVNAFLKARQQIEKTLSTEGGSELSGFFRGGSSDLQAELRKNRELCALVEARLDGIDFNRHRRDGPGRPSSSYEFLKSILN